MKRLKVTMLGISGSGKSSFFSGLYHSMVTGAVLAPDGKTVIALNGLEDDGKVHGTTGLSTAQIMEQYKIRNIMSNREGTWNTENFNFAIDVIDRNNITYSLPLYIFDYRGGLLTDIDTDDDEEEATVLMEKVKDSDAVLILLDSIKLANNANNLLECKERVGADRINIIMKSMIQQMQQNGVTVLTLLTKTDSDRIPDQFKVDGYAKLCELAKNVLDGIYSYSSMLIQSRGWSFNIIPITAVGEGNSTTKTIPGTIGEYVCELNVGASPKQKNIDLSLIYAIYKTLFCRIEQYDAMIRGCAEKIVNAKKIGFDRKARLREAELAKEKMLQYVDWKNLCENTSNVISEAFSQKFTEEIKG